MSDEAATSIQNASKRDSILCAQNTLHSSISENFRHLRKIWDLVGMSDDQRRERMQTAVMHVKHLLEEMVNEEQEMYDSLKESIISYGRDIVSLCRELGCQVVEPDENCTLLKADEFLRGQLESLCHEKRRRLHDFAILVDEDKQLSAKLGEKPAINPDDSLAVPNLEQLDALRLRNERNRLKVQKHQIILEELKTEIYRLMSKLSYTPRTDVEKRILAEPIEELPLSDSFLNELKVLRLKLHDQYEAYIESIRQRVNEVKNELELWWTKCQIGQLERSRFTHVSEENFDEKALNLYSAEISKLKAYYAERQVILDKINLWKELWNQKLAYEDKDKDAHRLLNRGGALLQEEKERKKLEKRLPAVKKEIKALARDWDSSHVGKPFCIDGVLAVQHLDKIEEEYNAKKEAEKTAKVRTFIAKKDEQR